ncbi:MAG: HAMP domain-containing histidine kinase [Candidatus Rokubacteria bacterium]|nr:HAMP domain-containing histidine kinase [Candidatus Rokubacteria bacterium]
MTIRLGSLALRFSAFGLLAIALPAAILAVLGYVSLRQWETSSELLFREQAREMASMAMEKIEMVLLHTEDEILQRIQTILQRPGLSAEALGEVSATVPFIQRLYLFDRRGRLLFPAAGTGEDVGGVAGLLVEISQGFWERGGRRHLVIGDQVLLAAVLKTSAGTPVLAALSRNPEVLRREILGKTLGSLEGPSILAVIDNHDRPVYTREPLDRAERIAAVSFGEALSSWRVALYQPHGMSPRQVVRRQTTVFTIAFGLLLVVIAVGLGTTYRLVRRETEMARLKADFVANVSHDLKTPLSLIRMFGETLEMGRVADEPTRQEYYRVITRESERLSRLIDNVLDFSRIEGGQRKYDVVPTTVEPLIRETVEAFGYVLAQQGFKVEVAVPPDLPPVPMDAGAVSQALANLVDNAIKYSADRKSLRIEVRIEGDALALSVADAGIGIPPEEQEKIFGKFYRVGRSETQGRRGSGVGLALVRHVALAHGGRVTVESRPGEGSRFTLRIPLSAGRD